jgi:putative adenylate-forming enzyme
MERPPAGTDPWAALRASLAGFGWLARTSEIWWTRRGGPALVAFARIHSPFYRAHYRHVPEHGFALEDLPSVGKRALMEAFDDWVTDPMVKRADVDAFVADPERIGERYLDRYVLWKSSGSTGEPGIYVQDAQALDVCDALIAAQLPAAGLTQPFARGLFSGAGRAALIAATGEHFATVASWRRLRGSNQWLGSRLLSLMDPLADIVAALNEFSPAFVASYPTMLSLLASERVAGRLTIAPACLWSGGEYLAPATRAAIERAFGCRVANEYGASECMSIAFGCTEDWLHVNADWVILEAVDREHRPVPPGASSHTALLTNLANRVQPIIRYDLGDSIMVAPEPCACGSALPAIRVEGRHDDVITLAARDGALVPILPLALATVVEESADVHRFQIVQESPRRIRLRLAITDAPARRRAFAVASRALADYLASQSLADVEIVLDRKPPVPDAPSGKLRQVIAAEPPATRSSSAWRRRSPASP